MSPVRICVTGGQGFIGSALVTALARQQTELILPTRRADKNSVQKSGYFEIESIDSSTDWAPALKGCRTVVHLAGLAHIFGGTSDRLREFRTVNTLGTLRLAEQAIAAGVKRFVFISSIGVNGAFTKDAPFNEETLPSPHADYALSKLEAEQGLEVLVRGTGMDLVIIRPPLVYAGHAPGNFARLLKLVHRGLPLPLASVKNQRSMIALDNLVDLIVCCIEHPAAADQVFLVSDGTDVSTRQIVELLSIGMEQRPTLFPFPDVLMRQGAKLLGREGMYTQLCGSLVVDSSKARSILGWSPVIDTKAALTKAGRDYARTVASR
ncbi:NAD-dependent epimerase/dehydratase family protein [Pseudomonas matsuisoli]|uniref:NAD-dependent epimerase n=1 Tax=Pseudomonas matsuisoli TaxID=1515666 RepID=A0A917Q2S2_9PSED|nr:NAD-dependent epimerase/dehydratase family protein [Pseudomonas matsuisoli]GGK10628.1 NAD-dependent epimerase [Pseudomonas matsuisoli]